MKIFVSKHAMTRFRQRFSLVFHPSVMGRYEFVADKFSNAIDDTFRLKMSIGKYNALCVKSGAPVVVKTYNGFMKFVAIEVEKGLLIKTCYRCENIA